MRVVGLLVMVAACTPFNRDPYPGGYTYDPGQPQPGDGECRTDGDCGASLLCARDLTCESASDLIVAHVNWTVSGKVANPTSCVHAPDLDITFATTNDYHFGFSPVPCDQGRFTVDKLPRWYTRVGLGPLGDRDTNAVFDATGNAMLDLPY